MSIRQLLLSITVFFFFCGSFALSYSFLFAQTSLEYEQKLRNELAEAEKERDALDAEYKKYQGESATLSEEIGRLNAQIKLAESKIKVANLTISELTKDIGTKSQVIERLGNRIDTSLESLTDIVRKIEERDHVSLPEILLGNSTFSNFFSELDSYITLSDNLNVLVMGIKSDKQETESERVVLETRKEKEIDARQLIEEQKRVVDNAKLAKDKLLKDTKGKESLYKGFVQAKEQKIAQIRSALFSLRGTDGIPFGDAYDYAVVASRATGVRPALILAILTQESDLGKNMGSCLMTNATTGDGIGKNSGTAFERVMAAPRDSEPFLTITARLGRDWKSTPVSCPPDKKWYSGRGYGGGMGPSQFIPSTWELYKKNLGSLLGLPGDSVDPWNPQHAIMATAAYMRDIGAASGSYTAEKNAACKYYSGAACKVGRKPPNAFYGEQVLKKAATIQETMIDPMVAK